MKLYDYAFSNAPVRARIVLYLKNVPFDRVGVDLLECRQPGEGSFREVNPQGMVPTLVDGDLVLNQSVAIAEYLDEIHPAPRLLPRDAKGRARVRSLALMIACDGQPVVNLRIRRFLTGELGFSRAAMLAWVRHWLATSLTEYETMLVRYPVQGTFSHGEEVTLADVFLVPHVVLATRFGVDLSPYRRAMEIHQRCASIDAFKRALAEYVLEDPAYGLGIAADAAAQSGRR
jgi:maleylacetoacetate isomerase